MKLLPYIYIYIYLYLRIYISIKHTLYMYLTEIKVFEIFNIIINDTCLSSLYRNWKIFKCFRKKKVLELILPYKSFQDFFSMYIFHIIVHCIYLMLYLAFSLNIITCLYSSYQTVLLTFF